MTAIKPMKQYGEIQGKKNQIVEKDGQNDFNGNEGGEKK